MTITLEAIEAKQSELSSKQIELLNLIESFKIQIKPTEVVVAAATISLASGERYAGLVLDDDGKPSHHLILLPEDVKGKSWSDAAAWAVERGGELPTRREQSLLFANLKQHFEKEWYWSAEEYESNDAFAWCQYFPVGTQLNGLKVFDNCRARAVRRLTIL
ncbi:DUF1566 domain-containing protein [Paraburkholderia tropica]|uniref:DUF1566 domain-containing protein n=1 Tax=Paraburkholderia tropica TaxID=92647 RepID=UPI002AB6A325|nr:DUF1566 domain-containing protein [Paraburkholderia tropica]